MTSQRPDPPIPADADLRHFPCVNINANDLRSSDMAIEGDPADNWFCMMLLMASWHQVPAGSLPDDDAKLAYLAGLGRDLRTWRKHKSGALRGWILCSDGRLYHPMMVEAVQEALQKSRQQRANVKKRWDRDTANSEQPIENIENPNYHGTTEAIPRTEQNRTDIYIPPSLRSGGCPPPPCDQAVEKPPDDQPPLALEATGPDEPERAFSAYNAAAERAGLPKALKFDAARKAKLRQRLKDCGGLSGWVAALARLEASAMCCGDNNRGWRADLDFLLQSQSFTRLMEGRYDNRPSAGSSHADQRCQPLPDAPGKRDQRARKAAFFAGAARAFGG